MENMCVVIDYLSVFTKFLLFIQNSESGLSKTGYFMTDVYNALQIIFCLSD